MWDFDKKLSFYQNKGENINIRLLYNAGLLGGQGENRGINNSR